MAKKGKTEGVLARETRLRGEAAGLEAAAQAAAATQAAEAAAQDAEAAKGSDTPPAGSGRKRAAKAAKAAPAPKKARYVREKKGATPEAAPAALAPRTISSSGRMLSKGVTAAPRDAAGPNRGPERPRAKP